MLVVGRHINERITIGDDIVITVVDVRGGKVRIGIEAPADTKVMRDDLLTRERLETIRANANAGHAKGGAA